MCNDTKYFCNLLPHEATIFVAKDDPDPLWATGIGSVILHSQNKSGCVRTIRLCYVLLCEQLTCCLISTAKLVYDCFSVYLQQHESVVTLGIHNNSPGKCDEDHIIPICCVGNLYFEPLFPRLLRQPQHQICKWSFIVIWAILFVSKIYRHWHSRGAWSQ